MKKSNWYVAVCLGASLSISALFSISAHAESDANDVFASTPQGDQVILHPNGRWEFVDTKKAAVAKEVASQYIENQGCPNGTQGGLFGLGRCITPGDKDYNRGSMSGKGR